MVDIPLVFWDFSQLGCSVYPQTATPRGVMEYRKYKSRERDMGMSWVDIVWHTGVCRIFVYTYIHADIYIYRVISTYIYIYPNT